MNSKTTEIEKKVFLISVVGTLTFAIIGFIIYLLSKSQAVLLDSLFSLIFGLVTLISIWVVSISSKSPSDNYPFGLIQARPMLELFKGILLLSFIVSAVFNAINTIISGGAYIHGKIIILYSLASSVISSIVIITFYFIRKNTNSPLITLEIIQWKQDTLISLSIGIVFCITLFIEHPYVHFITPYLDSLLVIIIGLIFTPSIVKVVTTSGKQLLLASPPDEIRKKISEYMLTICKKNDLEIKKESLILTGGLLYVDIEIYVKEKLWNWDMVNTIRNNATMYISSVYPDSEVFVSFYDIDNVEDVGNVIT